MSLDAIKKSILSDAEAKASAIDSDANSEVKRILKEAEDKAKEIVKRAEREAATEAQRLVKEAQAGAETEASSILLEAKGEAIERALKKVVDQAQGTLSKNYSKKLFDSGLKQFKEVSSDQPAIRTSKKNAGLFKNSRHAVEYTDVDGFIFSTPDGKISLNATVPSIVSKEKDAARKFISMELFGEGTSGPRTRSAHTKKSSRPKRSGKAKKHKGRKSRG